MKPFPSTTLIPFVLAVAAIAATARTDDAEQTVNHALRALPASAAVTVDGSLDEWDQRGAIIIADHFERPSYLARATAMYDAEGLYLSFEIRDRTPMGNQVDPAEDAGGGWRDDCVQLRLDTSPQGRAVDVTRVLHLDCYWYAAGERPTAHLVYGDYAPGGRIEAKVTEAVGQGIEAGFRRTDDGLGYVQEMRLDWALLRPVERASAKAGDAFALAIEVTWGPEEAGEKAWRLTDVLSGEYRRHSAVYDVPDAWGRLEFVAEDDMPAESTNATWRRLVERFGQGGAATVTEREPIPCAGTSAICQEINAWYEAGTAAGNVGDYYDNRDGGHSLVDVRLHPQVRKVVYTKAEQAAGQHWALSLETRAHPTVGNSSTSGKPTGAGSNPRRAYRSPSATATLYRQYRNSNLYVYPEHQDYDPGHNGAGGHGDLFPINSPYLLISQGSSGSDRPFVAAAFRAMAAFRPEVKQRLVEQGILIPTVQALLRASNLQVKRPTDYFTGKAHPPVFRGEQIDEAKMARLAQSMTIETIPPLVQLKVVEEQPPDPDHPGAAEADEKLCDTPGVIARVFRRPERHLQLKVSALESIDIADRPIKFRWVLLQGDPQRVRIEPTSDGSEARITVAWHDRFPIHPDSEMESNRVDIGVFASCGEVWSAPAFICVTCPDNELRTYDEADRLVDLHHKAMTSAVGYPATVLLPSERNRGYAIHDWPTLIERACQPDDALASRLLHAELNEAQRRLIREAGEEFRARREAWRQRLDAFRYAFDKMADTAPTQASPEEKSTLPGLRQAEYISEPLLRQDPQTGASAKGLLEGVLNRWINDPSFYVRHKENLEKIIGISPQQAGRRVARFRERLVELGILREDEQGHFTLHSVRDGEGPPAQRLTAYERSELGRLHVIIINELLLPDCVKGHSRANVVDRRLVGPEPYWDVYTYETAPTGKTVIRRDRRETGPIR